ESELLNVPRGGPIQALLGRGTLEKHHNGDKSSSRPSFLGCANRFSRYRRASSWPPRPKANASPNISDPNTMANASNIVSSPMPRASTPTETENRIITVRIVRLSIFGEGRFAFTDASKAAREKKLEASSPKKNTNSAINSRGRNAKKRGICS